MAATPVFMFASWFSSLALGGMLTGLPLGVPPLPEDPALSRIAPDECLWYFTSAGMATPDPASENQAEQLLAELTKAGLPAVNIGEIVDESVGITVI